MQKESIERLRVGAYQSSREEVKRRGKEMGCREEVYRDAHKERTKDRVKLGGTDRYAEKVCRERVQI